MENAVDGANIGSRRKTFWVIKEYSKTLYLPYPNWKDVLKDMISY